MNPTMELLILQLRSEAEEIYLSKECREKTIQEGVKMVLTQKLDANEISSTDYQEALDILKRYEINQDQV